MKILIKYDPEEQQSFQKSERVYGFDLRNATVAVEVDAKPIRTGYRGILRGFGPPVSTLKLSGEIVSSFVQDTFYTAELEKKQLPEKKS